MNASTGGLAAAARAGRYHLDRLKVEIGGLEQRLAHLAREAEQAAARLEAELRVAAECPDLDTGAFVAAQRQRLEALASERTAAERELAALKEDLAEAFLANKPVEQAAAAAAGRAEAAAERRRQQTLDELGARRRK